MAKNRFYGMGPLSSRAVHSREVPASSSAAPARYTIGSHLRVTRMTNSAKVSPPKKLFHIGTLDLAAERRGAYNFRTHVIPSVMILSFGGF